MASSPSHFKHCNGSMLRPVLLLGLKWFWSTCCTSSTVINSCTAFYGSTKVSCAT